MRVAIAVGFLFAGALTAPLQGQVTTTVRSGSYGGFTSRYIPDDVWLRMLTRPEEAGAPASLTTAAPRDSIWSVTRQVLEDRGVKLTFTDPANGEMGALNGKVYRRLGREPLSNYLRCGEGMTGPNADTYVVYLSVIAFLRPSESAGRTMAFVLVTGHAVDLPNGRNAEVMCTTTGRLETQLVGEIGKRLGTADGRMGGPAE